jgi:hypothetical protein
MKETTRQVVLLVGVLSLLTSALVVVNFSQATSQPASDQVNETDNQTQEQTSPEEKDPDTVVGQSIRGWQMLYNDIQVTINDLLGLGDSSEDS